MLYSIWWRLVIQIIYLFNIFIFNIYIKPSRFCLKIPNPGPYAVGIGKILILRSASRNNKPRKIFSSNSSRADTLYNKSDISDFPHFVSMNMSRSEELRYWFFYYTNTFYENKSKMTIFADRNCPLQ